MALLARYRKLYSLEPDASHRLANLRPLVVETVSEAALEAALRDIGRGDGGELLWRLDSRSLSILAERGFTRLRFEEKLPVFPRGGRAPNLDAVLDDPGRIVAVVSKLCEHLAPGKRALFKESYQRVVPDAHPTWQALYNDLTADPERFSYLDAAQLVKHYLGMKPQLRPRGTHAGRRPRPSLRRDQPSRALEELARGGERWPYLVARAYPTP